MLSGEAFRAVVEAARQRLVEVDGEQLVGFLQSEGLDFIDAVKAVRELKGISLGEATKVVHSSAAYRDDQITRESFWADLHRAAERTANEVQQPGTATDEAEPHAYPLDRAV